MARTENIELTVICLIYRENRILLQNRVKEDWKAIRCREAMWRKGNPLWMPLSVK